MNAVSGMKAADLFDLTGEVAMVTGASSGLGMRFARVLAANGAKVALVARRKERLQALAAEIAAAGGAAAARAGGERGERLDDECRGRAGFSCRRVTIVPRPTAIGGHGPQ